MKWLNLLLVPFIFLLACQQSETPDETTEEVTEEIAEEEMIEEVSEPDGPLEEEVEEDQTAFFKGIYYRLYANYLKDYERFINEKDQLLTMSRHSFSVYHDENQTWYFNKEGKPVFYISDMGGEGGYMSEEFKYFKNGKLWLQFLKEDDGGHLSTKIKALSEDETLEAMQMSLTYDGDSTFNAVNYEELDVVYKKVLKAAKKDGFKAGNKYVFEDIKQVESEYGGMESEGYELSIDSLLFPKLYK
ncbi:hypothetical protein K6119_09635 [Paracrocinitomix mangrovi]|uniref:hypothetical protein n=1 Tax=Paracrocinitomix mangrovi TaxID=2862509 RepID=UPI001C8E0C18|nr:hypothetical protein [Paracrocinitomix mangrovi]UKN03752.1 hypothetical protein K6119_09635 [Paracrocinitomix mangrovi]